VEWRLGDVRCFFCYSGAPAELKATVVLAGASTTLASSSSLAVRGAFGVSAVSSPAPAMTA